MVKDFQGNTVAIFGKHQDAQAIVDLLNRVVGVFETRDLEEAARKLKLRY